MNVVDKIIYIKGTDKVFTLRAEFEKSQEPKDLSALVAAVGDELTLKLPGVTSTIELTLDQTNTEGYLDVVDAASGLAGKVQVTIKDGSTLKVGNKQDMELIIKEGAGPDFEISCVQFKNSLEVKDKLF